MKTLLIGAGLVLPVMSAAAQPRVGIDQMVPTVEQLGEGWTSNRIAVLVDPLSSPSVVTNANESPGLLELAQNAVGANGREAYGMLRCAYGTATVLAWLHRFKSQEDIPPDWGTGGTDKTSKIALDRMPKVGEERRCYRRDDLHEDIVFRRANYLVVVEAVNAPTETLKQMAEVLDANLVKGLKQAAARNQRPTTAK